MRRFNSWLAAGATILASVAALAGTATIRVSQPTGAGVVTVTINFPDGTQDIIPISVTQVMTAQEKRDQIAVNLLGRGYSTTPTPQNGVKIEDLPEGTTVAVDSGTTGERVDRVIGNGAREGFINFDGFYDPFAADGQPAEFTAGFVTSAGSYLAQVSADELQMSTDGFNVSLALFERLLPAALDLGVELDLLGPGLRVGFPGLLGQRSGVVFGTTSLSGGARGDLHLSSIGGSGAGEGLVGAAQSASVANSQPRVSEIEFDSRDSSEYCVYMIEQSTCDALDAGDTVCVNCPDSNRCPHTIVFAVVNDGGVECNGRWRNVGGRECRSCPSGGRRGWRFR